ncbi:HAD-like protein [Lojkania enalia]|uniref:HAD-like protein n=1 Tax=Lojkania enalia TaxID=147567 RepID=A0A9P4NB11_9PLEO|nr:HAD-like protein [Didymosphaeria enalia]
MAALPPPKAILFDIGGVCVVSPFQAILDYEIENGIPVGYINFAIQIGPHDSGAWQRVERGEVDLDDEWFEEFRKQLSIREHWAEYWRKTTLKRNSGAGAAPKTSDYVPAVPNIDAKKLFWRMMRISRTPDPWMYPALKKLRASGRFVLGALSNTVHFPTGILDDEGVLFERGLLHPPHPHPHADDSSNIQDAFDIFISSAHVGVRKPDPGAYELAVRELNRVGKEKGIGGVEAGEVLFLDDIGVNLKWAKRSGLRTIKVDLGRTREAVLELEGQTGVRLVEEKGRL